MGVKKACAPDSQSCCEQQVSGGALQQDGRLEHQPVYHSLQPLCALRVARQASSVLRSLPEARCSGTRADEHDHRRANKLTHHPTDKLLTRCCMSG